MLNSCYLFISNSLKNERRCTAIDTFGKRVVSAREKIGLSQKQFAEKLGISPTRLNYYEKDKREPDVLMIKNIARELEVDPNFLLGIWSDDMYEDFKRTKTDDERRYLFEMWGVPSDLKGEYRHLIGSIADSSFTDEESEIIARYRSADDHAKKIVKTVLNIES